MQSREKGGGDVKEREREGGKSDAGQKERERGREGRNKNCNFFVKHSLSQFVS